jgi:hypothetical protein
VKLVLPALLVTITGLAFRRDDPGLAGCFHQHDDRGSIQRSHFLLYDRRRARGRGGCTASSSAAAGAIVRKVLPAIGITIAMFVVVFVGLFPLRPHYAEPERLVIAVATRLCRTP